MIGEEQQLDDWIPMTEAERKAVYGQLDRMLESPLFRNSKRYPNMLRYVVEQALDGNEALLKERLLGMTVFHRSPDYDTNQDTVVRLTAGEIRKRIAQYYHQPEHAGELQIDLKPGSYVPVFRRSGSQTSARQSTGEELHHQEQGQAIEYVPEAAGHKADANERENQVSDYRSPMRLPIVLEAASEGTGTQAGRAAEIVRKVAKVTRFAPFRLFVAGAMLVLLAVGALLWRTYDQAEHAADRQLWSPILQEPGQVQLVIADLSATLSTPPVQQSGRDVGLFDLLRMGELVNYRDSLAQTDLVGFLARHNKPYRLELSSHASYPDLQRSASVLVGGLDNVWTMRVTEQLRFHFVRRGMTYRYAIEDREHPEQGGWSVDLSMPPERDVEDYAIVARIFDVTTGRPVLVAAGIGANGTAAAAEFLLDPDRVAELAPHAPWNWRRVNMEAVIRTRILDNHAGPPHLVAYSFW
jgi:hypothetical protein